MLIVKLAPEANGAHANQSFGAPLSQIPKGWTSVSPELEEVAKTFLPWVNLEISNKKIVAISENTAAKNAWLEALAAESQTEYETETEVQE